jgi:hypothetical protein
MNLALIVVTVLWIALGTALILYTEETRRVLRKVLLRGNLRWTASIPLLFGLVLAAGAFCTDHVFWLVLILGLVGIAKGVYLLFGSSEKIRGLFDWWFERAEEKTVRFVGLVAFTLGFAIFTHIV